MDSSEIWFSEYLGNRYLRKATDEGLKERLLDLAANLWSTDKDGAVSPPRHSENRHLIRRLYAHTIYEQLCRNPANYEFDEAAIRTDAAKGYKPPKLNRQISFSSDCFSKFGKKIHLLPALERGNLRIAPASAYADTSLNVAQHDQELEHFVRTPNQHVLTQLHVRDSDGTERAMTPEFGEFFRYMIVPNFYVWCCGLGYDARLFHEFDADAALVIHDKQEFVSRLAQAVQVAHPDSEFLHGPIRYYDPYTTVREQLASGYSKHFKYLYQNEYRFTWSNSDNHLSPFYVELGPLSDIASIVELV